ncbi:MAG TPA: hypothetical protein PKH00_00950 [Bacilli bacterium]|jgi:hypothetical protein|nr:hypothetical protein [Bacilli bacterium]HNZ73962.1 hypothetical protein [Bacilli bacterium]HOR53366.1 hypothetical protein [Bacilli bacterium]HPA98893.1 hypothetical protein [Bacilli bacterium]HPV55353.1 hypothetical protein [Bacilli bacterium]
MNDKKQKPRIYLVGKEDKDKSIKVNFDINKVIKVLRKRNPLFEDFGDFFINFFYAINKLFPKSEHTLISSYDRYKRPGDEEIIRAVEFTVSVNNKMSVPIKLEYKTKAANIKHHRVNYSLPNEGNHKFEAYNYIYGIFQMEKILKISHTKEGYTIFLTNDDTYLKKLDSILDADGFSLEDQSIKTGIINWTGDNSLLIEKEIPTLFTLKGEYKMEWKKYSSYKYVDEKGNKNKGYFYVLITKVINEK